MEAFENPFYFTFVSKLKQSCYTVPIVSSPGEKPSWEEGEIAIISTDIDGGISVAKDVRHFSRIASGCYSKPASPWKVTITLIMSEFSGFRAALRAHGYCTAGGVWCGTRLVHHHQMTCHFTEMERCAARARREGCSNTDIYTYKPKPGHALLYLKTGRKIPQQSIS